MDILTDWRRFIAAGFELKEFTPDLYHHLSQHCAFIAHTNREVFWDTYFNQGALAFTSFLNQFGGDLRPAEYPDMGDWFLGPQSDPRIGALTMQLIKEARDVFPRLLESLIALARHEYDVEMWSDLNARWQQLAERGMATAESMNHLKIIYEITFPFETFTSVYQITPQARRRMAETWARLTAGAGHVQPDLFAARAWLDSQQQPAIPRAAAAEPPPPLQSAFEQQPVAVPLDTQSRIDRLSASADLPPDAERANRLRRLSAWDDDAAQQSSSLSLPLNGTGGGQ